MLASYPNLLHRGQLKNNVSSIPNSTDHIKGHITVLRGIDNIPWNIHVYIPTLRLNVENIQEYFVKHYQSH